MTDAWALAMLMCGGLFAGGVRVIAWRRLPASRATELADLRVAFACTLRRVDRLEPAQLTVTLSRRSASHPRRRHGKTAGAARRRRLPHRPRRLRPRPGPNPVPARLVRTRTAVPEKLSD